MSRLMASGKRWPLCTLCRQLWKSASRSCNADSTHVYQSQPAFRGFSRHFIHQRGITQWLITSLLPAPAPPLPHCRRNLYYNKFIFPPRAVCCQIAETLKRLQPHAPSETSSSFSSAMTAAAVTSGIKTEQEDYTDAYCWLDFLIVVTSVSKRNPSYGLKPRRWLA